MPPNRAKKTRKWTDREVKKLQKDIVASVFKSLIADGHVDPVGKSDAELHQELSRYALVIFRQKPYVPEIVEHQPTILSKARALAKQGDAEIAVILYATWFEHWINSLMSKRGRHVPLSDNESLQCLYQMGLEAKYLCFPAMFQFPAMARAHLKTILALATARNEFVHYKFKAFDMNKPSPISVRCQAAVSRAEKTVRYLQDYERKHIYKRMKSRVKKLISGGRDSKNGST